MISLIATGGCAVLCCDTSVGQQGGNWVVMSSAPPLQTRHSHNNKHRATGETIHTVSITMVHTDIVSMSMARVQPLNRTVNTIFSLPQIFPLDTQYPDTSLHHIVKVCLLHMTTCVIVDSKEL